MKFPATLRNVAVPDRRLLAIWLLFLTLTILDFTYRVLGGFGGKPRQDSEGPATISPIVISHPPEDWDMMLSSRQTEDAVEAPAAPALDESLQSGDLSAIVLDGSAYVLQACFLVSGQRYAVLKHSSTDSGTATKLLRQGGDFGPYTVSVIEDSSVTLLADSGRKVNLRLFSRRSEEPRTGNQ